MENKIKPFEFKMSVTYENMDTLTVFIENMYRQIEFIGLK